MKNRNLPLKIAAVCLMFSFGSANAQDFKSIIQSHMNSKNTFMKPNLNNFEIILDVWILKAGYVIVSSNINEWVDFVISGR